MTYGYDAYGNLTDKFEPEVRTHITYDYQSALVTQVDTGYQTSALRTMQYSWLNGVAMGSKTDAQNGIIVSYTYDNVGRQTFAREQANSSYIRRTETIYDDVNRKVTVKNDLITEGDGKLQSITSL